MQLARVIGTVVATQKYEGLEGIKLLLVQPLSPDGRALGVPEVACDTVQAGPGELVYTVGSREAALALEESFVPVDLAIVGIVDDVNYSRGGRDAVASGASKAHIARGGGDR